MWWSSKAGGVLWKKIKSEKRRVRGLEGSAKERSLCDVLAAAPRLREERESERERDVCGVGVGSWAVAVRLLERARGGQLKYLHLKCQHVHMTENFQK